MKNDFLGRSLNVMSDFTIEEEMFLYHQTNRLKKNGKIKKDCSEFEIKLPSVGIYIVFTEPSTRTKESFINAAKFHKNAKTNILNLSILHLIKVKAISIHSTC